METRNRERNPIKTKRKENRKMEMYEPKKEIKEK